MTKQQDDTSNKTSTSKRWVVFNIGCIECGVTSNLVGVFDSEEHAESISKIMNEWNSWREGGMNVYEVYLLGELNKINEEYQPVLEEAHLSA